MSETLDFTVFFIKLCKALVFFVVKSSIDITSNDRKGQK